MVIVTKAMLDKNPNTLAAYARAVTRAVADANANTTRAAQKLAPELKIEPEVLLPLMKFNAYSTAFDETVDASFKFTNAWLVREGRIPKPVPVKDVLTTSIVEKVDPALVKWRPA
jgi:ABC-type nitrate/sulfonate/bicarbonate transport system substrate-binding protein